MRILSACLSQLVVTVVQVASTTLSRTDSTHMRGSRPNNLRLKRIFVSCPNSSHLTSRHVVHRTFDHIGHVHSFLIYNTIFLTYLTYTFQRVSTLCRSTTSSEWRCSWVSIHHRLWVQTACWIQGSSAFHRRQAVLWTPGSCWTRGFPCQTPFLPPTEHGVDLRFCWEHRDTASGLGLGRWTNSRSAGITTVRSEKQMRNDHKFITLHQKT